MYAFGDKIVICWKLIVWNSQEGCISVTSSQHTWVCLAKSARRGKNGTLHSQEMRNKDMSKSRSIIPQLWPERKRNHFIRSFAILIAPRRRILAWAKFLGKLDDPSACHLYPQVFSSVFSYYDRHTCGWNLKAQHDTSQWQLIITDENNIYYS